MGAGRPVWTEFRNTVKKLLSSEEPALQNDVQLRAHALVPAKQVTMHLPANIGELPCTSLLTLVSVLR